MKETLGRREEDEKREEGEKEKEEEAGGAAERETEMKPRHTEGARVCHHKQADTDDLVS